MKTLQQTQHDFMQALLNPHSSYVLLGQIADSEKLSAQAHLAIYQRSYISRLQQCMAAQFEALKKALGDELFFMFTEEYLNGYPSNSHTLNTLGDRFADFLDATRPVLQSDEKENWPAFIIELARFEYRLNVLFDLPDPTGKSAVIPADETTPANKLVLNPIHEQFTHEYPVCGYFRALKNQDSVVIPLPEKEHCLVIRHRYRLAMVGLDCAQELRIVALLMAGENWAAVEQLEPEGVAALQQRWVECGVLVAKV